MNAPAEWGGYNDRSVGTSVLLGKFTFRRCALRLRAEGERGTPLAETGGSMGNRMRTPGMTIRATRVRAFDYRAESFVHQLLPHLYAAQHFFAIAQIQQGFDNKAASPTQVYNSAAKPAK